MNVTLRAAASADLPRIARLIARENASPTRQCLHLADDPGEVLAELRAETPCPETQIVLAVAGDAATEDAEIAGLLGAALDEKIATAWLFGPYVSTDDDDRWTHVAGALLDRLDATSLRRATTVNAYFHVAHTAADALLAARGFTDRGVAHVYVAPRPPGGLDRTLPPDGAAPCVDLPEASAGSFAALHAEAFPDTWCSADEILGKRRDGDRVLVTLGPGGGVTGYVHAGLAESGTEGYVHFIGVRADHRRRGLGRALLTAAVRWLFVERDVPRIGLNVREGLDDARALYERLGFRLAHSGRARRLERGER